MTAPMPADRPEEPQEETQIPETLNTPRITANPAGSPTILSFSFRGGEDWTVPTRPSDD